VYIRQIFAVCYTVFFTLTPVWAVRALGWRRVYRPSRAAGNLIGAIIRLASLPVLGERVSAV